MTKWRYVIVIEWHSAAPSFREASVYGTWQDKRVAEQVAKRWRARIQRACDGWDGYVPVVYVKPMGPKCLGGFAAELAEYVDIED